jgi:hypothetical protein
MTQPIFIGVGGTGQNVLAAYLRLARMAGFAPAPFYVVDSDATGPQFTSLTELKREVRQVAGGGELPGRWLVNPYPTIQADRRTFGTLFGNLTGDRKALFDALFSEEAEQTQIRTGMYGRPAIGATCIRLKIQQDDDDLRELREALRGGPKHVVLVGSCFGGTGSGGVPMLAEEFAQLNRQPGYSLRVDALVFLPWFRLVLPEGTVSTPDRRLHERLNLNFDPNAAASIKYFSSKIRSYVQSLMLLGVRDPGQISRLSNESAQEETPHILNLLAALLVQNQFRRPDRAPKGVVGYWYEAETGLSAQGLEVIRDGEGSGLTLLSVIRRATLQQKWLSILRTFFMNYGRVRRWHRPLLLDLALARLSGPSVKESEVLDAFVQHLGQREKSLADSLLWVDRLSDGTSALFRLSAEDKRIQSPEYQQMCDDPLPALMDWCDQEKVVAKFGPGDLRQPVGFCDKLTDLFLAHLADHFNL